MPFQWHICLDYKDPGNPERLTVVRSIHGGATESTAEPEPLTSLGSSFEEISANMIKPDYNRFREGIPSNSFNRLQHDTCYLYEENNRIKCH
jgi:hypothetical protein